MTWVIIKTNVIDLEEEGKEEKREDERKRGR